MVSFLIYSVKMIKQFMTYFVNDKITIDFFLVSQQFFEF